MNKQTVLKNLATVAVTLAASGALMAKAGSLNETIIHTSADGVLSATVSYADLDLTTQAGQRSLYYRIDTAAEQVCGSSDLRVVGDVRRAEQNRSCARHARDRALSSVHAGGLAVVSK
jgi:UrcA family protein